MNNIQPHTPLKPYTLSALIGLAGGVLESLGVIAEVSKSTNSTAAIGYLVVPVMFVLAFAVYCLWGLCAVRTFQWWKKQPRQLAITTVMMALVAIALPTWRAHFYLHQRGLEADMAAIEHMHSDRELRQALKNSGSDNKPIILAAIAMNPAASPQLLDDIARMPEPSLFTAMAAMGKNRKGLAVMRLVLMNPNASSDTVQYLANHPNSNEYVLGDVASNPKASTETLYTLAKMDNYLVDNGLAWNPNTPRELFALLLARHTAKGANSPMSGYTLQQISQNTSAPPEVSEQAGRIAKEMGTPGVH